jgi:hypothetical protein
MPWHAAKYDVQCEYDRAAGAYRSWRIAAASDWAPLELELEDTGRQVTSIEGLGTRANFLLTITHPVTGYYRRTDGRIGSYSVWHPPMTRLTIGRAKRAWCGLYEDLRIMTRPELAEPHSVLLLPQITFQVKLPPGIVE